MRFAPMVLLLVLASWPSAVDAQGLRAQVYIVQKKIPRNLSERQLLQFARRHHTNRLTETDEEALEDREWRAELVIRFNKPPGDSEFHVLFYDTQDEEERFVEDLAMMVAQRDQRTYVNRIRLERPRFKPERRMALVVTVRRHEVARKSFHVRGEEKERTGEVSFSDDEVRNKRAEESKAAGEGGVDGEAQPAGEEAEGGGPVAEASANEPAAGPAAAPPPVEPASSGKSGGLCVIGATSAPRFVVPFALVVFGLGLRRRRRAP